MKTILAAAALLSMAVPLLGTSYYPTRPNDAKAVYMSPDNFPAKGDGIADDSAVLQQAINKVRETTNQGILFVPTGRYRLTRTIYIWPGIRLIGFGTVRPTFVLAANTPGFQQGPAYMLFFAAADPTRMRLQRMRTRAHSILRSAISTLRSKREIRARWAYAPIMRSIAFSLTWIFTSARDLREFTTAATSHKTSVFMGANTASGLGSRPLDGNLP